MTDTTPLRRPDPPRRWAWGVIDWPFSFEPLAGQRVGWEGEVDKYTTVNRSEM